MTSPSSWPSFDRRSRISVRIEKRELHNVTVLDVKGSITLSEGGDMILKDSVTSLLGAGCNTIVVNLAEVQYIDSSGLAAIVQVYATSTHLGVPLYYSHPSARLQDLFQLTKLVTIFEVLSPEDLVGHLTDRRIVASCPSCEPDSWIALRAGPEYQPCRRCGIQLKLSSWPSVPEGGEADVECEILRAPTYDDEYVRLVIATTQTISVEGRLDLFASEVVTRIWHLVPPPRRVVFEVAQSQYTEAGLQPLLDLCAIADESNRSAIVITGVTDQSRDSLPRHPAVHERSSDAESALHLSGRQLPTLHLRVRLA